MGTAEKVSSLWLDNLIYGLKFSWEFCYIRKSVKLGMNGVY